MYFLVKFCFYLSICLYCTIRGYRPTCCIETQILIQITSRCAYLYKKLKLIGLFSLVIGITNVIFDGHGKQRYLNILDENHTPQLQIPDCCIFTSQYALFCNIGVDALAAPVPHNRDPFFTTTASCPKLGIHQ